MNYVAVYTHVLNVKNDSDSQWVLNLIYGTKDGHGCKTMSSEFVPFSTINTPTVVKIDSCHEWEEEVVPFDTIEEALEDIRKKEAYYDMNDIAYMYSGDYFGLTTEEQEKIMGALFGCSEEQPITDATSEWIELPDDIDKELPF